MKRIVGYGIGIVVCIVMMVVGTFGSFYFMHGKAMENGLKDNDLVYVHKTKDVHQGDVIAFYYNNKILVRRIVASGNDVVTITSKGTVYINNKLLKEDYVKDRYDDHHDIVYPYKVSEDCYFVLGDQRSASVDSRRKHFGVVKKKDIIGVVKMRVWPIQRLGGVS